MSRAIKHRIYYSVLIAVISWQPALATSVLEMDITALTKSSSNVVAGRVVEQRSQFDQNNKIIWTYSTLEVDQGIKGGELATLVVQQAGGAVDGITQVVHGISLLKPSEEVLLFVQPSSAAAASYKITGLSQGMYRLSTDSSGTKMATPVVDKETHFLTKGVRGKLVHTEAKSKVRSFDDLVSTIKSIE